MFHLANRRVDYKLNIEISGERLPFERTPKYLGVTLDRTLSYKQHLIDVSSKVTKRCNLLKRLAGNNWGADFSTLRSSALALCYSAAEYCSPVWSQSHHCYKVDVALNECLRLVSVCIKSTPTDILPVLCGIEHTDIRRDKNILEFCNRVFSEEGHVLDNLITHPLTNNRLRSRVPLSKRMHSLASDINGTTSSKSWATTTWRWRWQNLNYRRCQYISEPSVKPSGDDLQQHQWVLLNRVCSGYGRYANFMHRIRLSDNPNCI